MTYADLHALLEDYGDAPPELNDDERWLLNHLAVVAAALPEYDERYRALLTVHEAEGATPELRASALEAAGELAVLLQSVYRRPVVITASWQSSLDPRLALAAIDNLFYSFTLLPCHDGDDYGEARLEVEELDDLMLSPQMQAWFEEMGAVER